MNVKTALIAGALFAAGPTFAQTPATGTQQKPPAQHQPATPAQPAAPAQPAHQPGQAAKSTSPASDDKVDPAKEAAIRHLMDLTQTSKLGDNIRGYIDNQLRGVMSHALSADELPKFMDTFNDKLATTAPTSAVIDASIPIYARAFSMDDVQGLIQFYESPLGQRVIKALPQVSQQTEEAGMQLEQKAAMEALHSMTVQYPQLEQMLQPPNPQDGAAPTPTPAPAPAPEPQSKPDLGPQK